MSKPTQEERERAREIVACAACDLRVNHPHEVCVIERVAQALADTREAEARREREACAEIVRAYAKKRDHVMQGDPNDHPEYARTEGQRSAAMRLLAAIRARGER